MPPPERPGWSPEKVMIWAIVCAVVVVWVGPHFVRLFRPPPRGFSDFSQEWLSLRNYRTGAPVYRNQVEAIEQHMGGKVARVDEILPWNGHPPAAVLLVLPLGSLDFAPAQFVWNVTTFALFVFAIALVVWELRIPFVWASVFPAVVLVLLCHPITVQLAQGQLNCLLAFLIVVAWVMDRRGYPAWAGVPIGIAAAIKLVPAFLFLYFLCTRRWWAIFTGGIAFLAMNGLAAALFGIDAFRTYIQEVIPSLNMYYSHWRNGSLGGFWLSIFDPHEEHRVAAIAREPILARILVNTLRVTVVLVTAAVCWRAKSLGQRDRAFSLCIVGMVLVSPISWTHYLILLLLPAGLLWLRLPSGPARWGMWVVFFLIWFPQDLFAVMALGSQQTQALLRKQHDMLSAKQLIAVTGPMHAALVGLFLLTLLAPRDDTGNDDAAVEPPRGGP